jgi:hypothetical protein
MTTHIWRDRGDGDLEKRCDGCAITAVRTMRPDGGWGIEFFAPDNTRMTASRECGGRELRPPGVGLPEELHYVYLAPWTGTPEQIEAVGRELTAIAERGDIGGWHAHGEPGFLSMRVMAGSMPEAQVIARAIGSEAFTAAGLDAPRWGDVLAIPVPSGTSRPRELAAVPPAGRRAETQQSSLDLGLEAAS